MPPLTSCFEGVFPKEAHRDLFPNRQGLVPPGSPPSEPQAHRLCAWAQLPPGPSGP